MPWSYCLLGKDEQDLTYSELRSVVGRALGSGLERAAPGWPDPFPQFQLS